jgi:hypothetical protein
VSLCLRERNRQAPPRYNTHGIARSDSPYGHTARRFSPQRCAAWFLTEARSHRAKAHSGFCCFWKHRLAIPSVPLCLRERNRQAPPRYNTHGIARSDSPHGHTARRFSSQRCAPHGFSQRHGGTELKHTLDSAASGNTALRFPPCLCASVREIVKHLRETTPTKSLTAIRLWAYRTAILPTTLRAAWFLKEARSHRAKAHSGFCCFWKHRLATPSVPLRPIERNRQAPPRHNTHKIASRIPRVQGRRGNIFSDREQVASRIDCSRQ